MKKTKGQADKRFIAFDKEINANRGAKWGRPQSSFSEFCSIFEFSPISLWEADYSGLKLHLDDLKNKGVADLRKYFIKYPEEIVSLSQKINILKVNKAALKLYKANNEQEFLECMSPVFNKESYDVFRENLIALSEGKPDFSGESVIQTREREMRHILIKVVVPPEYSESLAHVFVYIIDISTQKQMEQALKESEARYRAIVENAYDAIIVVDTDTGIVVEVNKKSEQLFGMLEEEIVGMHFTQLHPEEEAENYRTIFQSHVKHGPMTTPDILICKKNGDEIPVSVSSSVIYLGGKKYISAVFRQTEKNSDEIRSGTDHPSKHAEMRSLPPGKTDALSGREREILFLIASGNTNRQIAQTLNISTHTVRTHRSRLMEKLNLHKTADVVRYALKSGLLDSESI
jgi:PAS domain S-box-containing protein